MDHHKLYLLRKRPLNRRQWAKRLIIASQLIMLWLIYVVWCKLWSNWKLYPHFGRLFLISKLRYIYKNQFLWRFDYSLIFFSDYHACIMDSCIVCFVILISLYVFHSIFSRFNGLLRSPVLYSASKCIEPICDDSRTKPWRVEHCMSNLHSYIYDL